MSKTSFEEIVKLNKRFYQLISEDFSRTRQKSWRGWDRVGELLKNQDSVLDIACGNGRFYGFLQDKGLKTEYLGIDSSSKLLSEAKRKYPKATFEKMDVLQRLPERIFDVIVVFGFTHHIPNGGFRQKWFEKVANLIKLNGFLVLTFWNYNSLGKPLGKDEIGFWGKDEKYRRYIHIYSDEEINKVCNLLGKKDFKEINRFQSDGRTGNLNTYLILKRT